MTEEKRQSEDETERLIDNIFRLARQLKDGEITIETLRDLVALERKRHIEWIENLVAEEVEAVEEREYTNGFNRGLDSYVLEVDELIEDDEEDLKKAWLEIQNRVLEDRSYAD